MAVFATFHENHNDWKVAVTWLCLVSVPGGSQMPAVGSGCGNRRTDAEFTPEDRLVMQDSGRIIAEVRGTTPMRASRLPVAICLCLATTLAHAVGIRTIDVPAGTGGPALHGAMWYPGSEPPSEVKLGYATLPGVRDCPVNGDNLPLVVISHGRGGDFIGHHDTAEALADAGFVVAAISHPGDTVTDMSRSDDLSALVERPADIKRLIDFMLGTSPLASRIDPERIGFFGFSRGGYTGLVLVGANPDWASTTDLCRKTSSHMCEPILSKAFPGPLTHDPRIKAAVIADPLAVMFTADSFSAVKVPVQLWESERGGDGVSPESVAAVNSNLPKQHEYHIVPNAAHFAFLTPCSPTLATKRPELCTDGPSFDRAAFHKQFDADVVTFLRTHLAKRP
jgi:predicted dienelactone hydrolase